MAPSHWAWRAVADFVTPSSATFRNVLRRVPDNLALMGEPIRILLVEKQQFVADALEALLSQQPGMVVVGNVRTMADSTATAHEMNPDVVILEFRLNDGLTSDAAGVTTQALYDAKVIF